jgi:hypothetical protein
VGPTFAGPARQPLRLESLSVRIGVSRWRSPPAGYFRYFSARRIKPGSTERNPSRLCEIAASHLLLHAAARISSSTPPGRASLLLHGSTLAGRPPIASRDSSSQSPDVALLLQSSSLHSTSRSSCRHHHSPSSQRDARGHGSRRKIQELQILNPTHVGRRPAASPLSRTRSSPALPYLSSSPPAS